MSALLRDVVFNPIPGTLNVKRSGTTHNHAMASPDEEGDGVDPYPSSTAIEIVVRPSDVTDTPISGWGNPHVGFITQVMRIGLHHLYPVSRPKDCLT